MATIGAHFRKNTAACVILFLSSMVALSSLYELEYFNRGGGDGAPLTSNHEAPILRRRLKEKRLRAQGQKQGRRNLAFNFMDPKSVELRHNFGLYPLSQTKSPQSVEITFTPNDAGVVTLDEGGTSFLIHPWNDEGDETNEQALLNPSEILIELVNPKPDCQYSITITSHNKYIDTATRLPSYSPLFAHLSSDENSLLYSWNPILPGQYEILVHEIDKTNSSHKTPLLIHPSPFPVFINEREG